VSTRHVASAVVATQLRLLRATPDGRGGAGLALLADRDTLQWRDGDLLFVVLASGQLGAYERAGTTWAPIAIGQPPPLDGTVGRGLAVWKSGGAYHFRSGLHLLGEWRSAHAGPRSVYLVATPGVHARFDNWIVSELPP
jgi:hypothetical protein